MSEQTEVSFDTNYQIKTITLYLQRLQVEGCCFASGILIKDQSSSLPWSQPSKR